MVLNPSLPFFLQNIHFVINHFGVLHIKRKGYKTEEYLKIPRKLYYPKIPYISWESFYNVFYKENDI